MFREKCKNKIWLKVLCWALTPVFIWLCLLNAEYMNYRSLSAPFLRWGDTFGKLAFAMLVLSLFFIILLGFIRRLWITSAVFCAVTFIMGMVNCLKAGSNGDNFFPWDFAMIGNAGELSGMVKFNIPPLCWLWLGISAVLVFLFWLSDARITLKWYFCTPVSLAVIICAVLLWNKPVTVEKMLGKFGMSFNDSILQSSNYVANGFVNAFTINCFALNVSEPKGYSEQAVEQVLSGYTESEATSAPDVIVILSEAFFDVRTLNGTVLSDNPLKNYDEILARENTVSGKLYTTAHGGGTVRTEFEVLTGLTVDYLTNGTSPYLYVKNPIDSYVSQYKAQGYKTTAIHSYNGKFYSRNIAYPLVGFDKFITESDMVKRDVCGFRRGYITDDTFMDTLIDELENNGNQNNFVFGITMENHQKYGKSNPEDIIIDVENDNLTEDVLDATVTYTQGLYYADKALGKLVDYIDNREKETVLVYFGDHLPSLAPNQEAYNQSGNIDISDGYSTEEFEYLYSAPYFIYSNYGVDYGDKEKYEKVSTYYLMSLVADVTGTAKTPYMQFLLSNFDMLPYYHARLGITLEGEKAKFIETMKYYTYYKITN